MIRSFPTTTYREAERMHREGRMTDRNRVRRAGGWEPLIVGEAVRS
jgi:hypothetical protein